MENQDFVYCIAALPDTLFAAKQSGLYRSADAGRTWEDAYASLLRAAPPGEAQAGLLPTGCVAAVQVGELAYVFAAVGGQILRSSDAGKTWLAASLDTPAPQVMALAISPGFAGNGLLVAATMQDGIFRSTDRGVSWTSWNFGLYDLYVNALAFIDDLTVVAGTQSGIFLSANGGRSWQDTNFPIECAPVQCITAGGEKTIYAGTQEAGLFVSRDAGKTWEMVFNGSVEQVQLHHGNTWILNEGVLRISSDGKHWNAYPTDAEITTFYPEPLVLGLANGEIQLQA